MGSLALMLGPLTLERVLEAAYGKLIGSTHMGSLPTSYTAMGSRPPQALLTL